MNYYRNRIKERSKIFGVELNLYQLIFLNMKVSDYIYRGIYEFDALDYA